MKDFIRGAWKALGGGLSAAAAAAGITWTELDWRELVAAFVVGAVGVYVSPTNKTSGASTVEPGA